MPLYLGIDTSNYTTSTALYDSDLSVMTQSKKLLPVKEGELGLRQSDAVFHHTKQLPELLANLFEGANREISAIGVSTKPRNADGSYMPCFLTGETVADSMGTISGIEVYKTSHQVGHILAALYSCGRLDLIKNKKPFIAFHVSGGTTDCLLCTPDDDIVLDIEMLATSLDLKAGQAIDRVGLMMGLEFPCGKMLEQMAMLSETKFKIKPTIKNGNCCLSGIENQCRRMLDRGDLPYDVALYCLKYIEATIDKMTEWAIDKLGNMPVIYAGGVMSDMLIRDTLDKKYDAYFAEPNFSCDNACGVALFAAIKEGCFE